VFLDAETKTMLATGNPRDLRDHCPDARVRAFLTRGEATPPPAPGAPRR
jgi:phospholipid/cholesterol/gamma-HCH transport system ATP-binding protein